VPEVGEHLHQLALAVDGAQKGCVQRLARGLHPLVPGDALFDDMIQPKLLARFSQRREALRRDERIARVVVDSRRVELLIDISLEAFSASAAQRHQRVQVAGARAECHAVEGDDLRRRRLQGRGVR
jgi:hypothetical protein